MLILHFYFLLFYIQYLFYYHFIFFILQLQEQQKNIYSTSNRLYTTKYNLVLQEEFKMTSQTERREAAYNKLDKAISEFIDLYYQDIQAGLKEVQEDETAAANIIGMYTEAAFIEQIQKKAMYQELKQIANIIYESETEEEANEKLSRM